MFPFTLASLRIRLILLVLLSLLPGLGFILSHSREDRQHLKAEAEAEAQRLTYQVASHQNQMIQGTRQLLVALAQLPQVRNDEPAQCSALFAKLHKQYPLYANLGVVNANGDWFCSALPMKKQVNSADRAWFQLAMQNKNFAIGDYQVDRTTGKPSVNLGYPVFNDQGRVEAVVVAALEAEKFTEIAATAQLPQEATIVVFDRYGTIFSQYPKPEKEVKKSSQELAFIQRILKQKQSC